MRCAGAVDHGTCRAPGAGGWIVEFRAGERASTRDELLAVGQQGGGMPEARVGEGTGGAPDAGGGIVELRAGEGVGAGGVPPRDEHLAIGQDCRGMTKTTGSERASG